MAAQGMVPFEWDGSTNPGLLPAQYRSQGGRRNLARDPRSRMPQIMQYGADGWPQFQAQKRPQSQFERDFISRHGDIPEAGRASQWGKYKNDSGGPADRIAQDPNPQDFSPGAAGGLQKGGGEAYDPSWDKSAQPDTGDGYTGPSAAQPPAPRSAATYPGYGAPDTTTTDPKQMIRENYGYAYGQGAAIDQQLMDQYYLNRDLSGGYRDQMNQDYWNLRDNPGYTPQEQQDIIRQTQYENLQATPQDFANLDPNEAEWSNMAGNPDAQRGWYDPAYAEGIDQESADRQRGTRGEMQGRFDTGLSQEAEGYGKAIDPTMLRRSEDYMNTSGSALAGGETAVRGAVDPNKMRWDQDVSGKVRMTDRDVQDYIDRSGRTVGNQTASAVGDIERAAAASGAATPQALSAMRARLESQGGVNSADAMLDARLAARGEQARREMELEQNRVAAEKGYAGLRSQAEQALLAERTRQAREAEVLRMQGEQDVSDRQMTATQNIGVRGQQNASEMGRQGLQSEQNIGAQRARTQQNNTQTGIDIERDVDRERAKRAAGLYDIRNQNAVYSINTKYNQGIGVNDRLSKGYQTVADARRKDLGEVRDWATGQTQDTANRAERGTNSRINLYGTQMGATNTAAGQAANYDINRRRIPGIGTKLIGAGLGAVAGYATGGPKGAVAGGARGYGGGG